MSCTPGRTRPPGNDYPHHEGSWPHSEEVVQRTMGDLSDAERRLILGGNAAKLHGIPIPR